MNENGYGYEEWEEVMSKMVGKDFIRKVGLLKYYTYNS